MNIVFGGVDQGAAAFARVQDFAASTQFSVQTLTQAFVQLKGAGVEPTEELLQTFADTASVTTDQMGTFQAALDLVSRSTAGGLGLEDLNRLADRGIPVFNILQERLGLTRLEVSEFGKTAEGANTIVRELLAGLNQRFGGALAEQAGLLNFELNQLGDAFDKLQVALFAQVSDTAASVVQSLTASINSLADAINNGNQTLETIVSLLKIVGAGFLAVKLVTLPIANIFIKIFDTVKKVLTPFGALARIIGQVVFNLGTLKLSLELVKTGIKGLGVRGLAAALVAATGAFAPYLAAIGAVGFALFETAKLFGFFKKEVEEQTEAVKQNAHVLEFQAEQERLAAEEAARLREETQKAADAAEAFKRGYDNASKSIEEFKREIFDSNDPLSNYQEFLSKIIGESNALAVEQVFAGRALQFLNDLFEKGGIATRTYQIAVEKLNGILGIQNEELTEGEKAFEDFNDRIGLGAVTITEYLELQRQLQALIEKYPELFEEAAKATDNLDDALKENEGIASFLQTLGRAQKALSEDLATALVEGKSASEAFQQFFKKLVVQLIADALRLAVIQPILGSLFGISFGAGGAISGLTGGGLFGFLGRADGGPVMANRPYIVGERGPELFVPGQSGGIVPNEALGMGGGTTVNYNIQAVDAQSFQALVARDPEFIFAVTEAGRRRLPQ